MTSPQCRVTVGFPVYNAMQFLPEALRAIREQTYRDFVVHVSDNCSTDGTYEYFCEVAKSDPRIIVTRNDTNIGAYDNFMLLVERCETEYFFWAAADDRYDVRFIERSVEALDGMRSAGLVFCYHRVLNHVTNEIGDLATLLPSDSPSTVRRLLARLINPRASLVYGLHRTSILKDCIRTVPKIDYFDTWLTQEIAARSSILIIPLDMYRLGVKTVQRVPYAVNGKRIQVWPYYVHSVVTVRKYTSGVSRLLLLLLLSLVATRLWVGKPRMPAGKYVKL